MLKILLVHLVLLTDCEISCYVYLCDCIVFHAVFIFNLQAGPHECLKDIALKILQNKVVAVPIIHSSSEDGSFPQLLHLASLSGMLNCKLLNLFPVRKRFGTNVWIWFSGICRHFKHSPGSLPILQLPIGSIPLGTWAPKVRESNKQPLAMLRPNASLGAALSLLIQGDHSSLSK